MAGTLVVTEHIIPKRGGLIGKLRLTWTSDGSGNVNGTATPTLNGRVERVATNPSATAPTDNYDIVLNDEDGVDIMAAALANRDTANTEQITPSAPPAIAGALTPIVTNAGASKIGDIVIYYSR